ncbi:creatininase family protein [Microbacterium sp. A204]|uniref:creatininase family protein n=1 Tax=Microbacterium sp. A204 TaxID=3457321 RepID=UPI003FD3C4AF
MSTSPAAIERLSPEQIEERLAAVSVAYLPLGSLEFHGPHLPIGLDALTAYGICLGAAEQHGGVVLPAYYQAVGGEHMRYPWTIMSSSPESIATLLAETLSRLDEMGVRRAVILSGHFADEQRDLVMSVADRWNATGSSMVAIARTLAQAPELPVAPDHAGRFESLMLHAIDPTLVNVGLLPDAASFPAPADEDPYGQQRHSAEHPLHGVFGADPRRLDVDSAAGLMAHYVSWIAGLAETA